MNENPRFNFFLLVSLVSSLMISASMSAQAPQGINYQAVARNSAGTILPNKTIGLRFTISNGSPGAVLYRETFTTTTNQFGLIALNIGKGTPTTGTFSSINWASVDPWLKVEMDPDGGTAYMVMGESQLQSVPYALFAATGNEGPQGPQGEPGVDGADGNTGPQGIQGIQGPPGLLTNGSNAGNTPYWNGTTWVVNNNNIFNNGANVGIGTNSPGAKLDINGQLKISGGTPGNGKVLTSDATGLASWQTSASVLGGSGTINYVPKFNTANTIGNSQLFDDGTNMGIGTTAPVSKLTIHTPNNTDGFTQVSDGGIVMSTRVGGVSASIGTSSNHIFRIVANNIAAINVTPGGLVAVGTTDPGIYPLKVSHSLYGLDIENTTTGTNWEINVGNNLLLYCGGVQKGIFTSTNGEYFALSDERLKTNIKPMSIMLDKIMQLKPYSYQFKNTDDTQAYNGFMAQDVMKIFPSLVVHTDIPERHQDVFTMDYSGFGVLAIKGIQELEPKIESQDEKIAVLENRIAELEKTVTTLIANNIGTQSKK